MKIKTSQLAANLSTINFDHAPMLGLIIQGWIKNTAKTPLGFDESKLRLILEIAYQYVCHAEIHEDLKPVLLEIRKNIWRTNSGVPPIDWQRSHKAAVESGIQLLKDYFQGTVIARTRRALARLNLTKLPAIILPELPQMPKENTNGVTATLNDYGATLFSLDPFSKEFIQRATPETTVLILGAGFGPTVIAALERGATVYCNDLSPDHLALIRERCPSHLRKNLILLAGRAPDELQLPQDFFDAILISRVLHFYPGVEVEHMLTGFSKWLKPNSGELIMINETPFIGPFKELLPNYHKNKKAGVLYPQEIENPLQYLHKNDATHADSDSLKKVTLPKARILNLFDVDSSRYALTQAGLTPTKAKTFSREGTHAQSVLLDGRESVGVIGIKPHK